MAYLDEDQPYAPRRAPAPRRRGPDRQQLAMRRAVAAGVGILILILLVIGVKGCLNARKQRGLENFRSDVDALVDNSAQLSDEFFKELASPGSSGLDLQAAIDSDRGTAEGLLTRAQDVSAPGSVAGAKADLVLAFTLRRDGIAGVAGALEGAGSSQASITTAENLAVDHMKELLASDVIYVRAKSEIDQALADADVTGPPVKPSVFFQDPTTWLDPGQFSGLIASAGSGATSGTACPPNKVCGLALASTVIGGAALTAGAPATVTGDTIDVSVQNQGDVTETGINVSYRFSNGGGSGSATLDNLPAGQTKSVSIKLKPAPPSGQELSLDIDVTPVPGEHVSSNNKASYTVTFG